MTSKRIWSPEKEDIISSIDGKKVIFSQTIMIFKDHPIINITGVFDLNLTFETNKKINEKGEVLPTANSSINKDEKGRESLNIVFSNFFYIDSIARDGTSSHFFRKEDENDAGKIITKYHFSIATRLLSKNNDALSVTLNVLMSEDCISE